MDTSVSMVTMFALLSLAAIFIRFTLLTATIPVILRNLATKLPFVCLSIYLSIYVCLSNHL
jgi:hypothetical protein